MRAINADGRPEKLPGADQPAAGLLQLEGFAEVLAGSGKYAQAGLPAGSFEAFTLLACQE